MLMVGLMDHNADPSSTFHVVNRLIKAGKTFNLLVVPEADHGTRGQWTRYKNRNLFDYFARNLLGPGVPNWNAQNKGPADTVRPATSTTGQCPTPLIAAGPHLRSGHSDIAPARFASPARVAAPAVSADPVPLPFGRSFEAP